MKDNNLAALLVAVLCFGIDAICTIFAPTAPGLGLIHQNSYLIIGACLAIFNPRGKSDGGT